MYLKYQNSKIKAFCNGFKNGFKRTIGYSIAVAVGMLLMYLSHCHPYDRCAKMYTTPEDISECVWILQNKI